MTSTRSNSKNSKSQNDLTSIEDLSELIHTDDPEIEALFKKANETEEPSLAKNFEEEILFDSSEEVVNETIEEDLVTNEAEVNDHSSESSYPETENVFENFENSFENSESNFEDQITQESSESNFEDQNAQDSSEFSFEETFEESKDDDLSESQNEMPFFNNDENQSSDLLTNESLDQELNHIEQEISETNQFIHEEDDHFERNLARETLSLNREEKISLEEIKNENIQILSETSTSNLPNAANPAFSLKLIGIDYNHSNDILNHLEEFSLLDKTNRKIFEQSIKTGALLISDINEYTLISLASKLKKYGVQLMMGPSDLIFQSKTLGTTANRGNKISKLNDQKKKGQYIFEKNANQNENNEVLVSFSEQIHNHLIHENYGPVFNSEIIEEEDLLRSAFARKSLENQNTFSSDDKDLFEKYSHLLDERKEKLVKHLKVKAIMLGANSLIGLKFMLNTQSVKNKTLFILTAQAEAVTTSPKEEVMRGPEA